MSEYSIVSDALAQVEAPGALFRRRKQAFQAAAQVSGLADVRLGGWIGGAQKEDGRRGGHGREQLAVAVRREIKALAQHSSDCSARLIGSEERMQQGPPKQRASQSSNAGFSLRLRAKIARGGAFGPEAVSRWAWQTVSKREQARDSH